MVEKLKAYLRFEELVAKILRANGFDISEHDILGPDKGYDFLASREEGTFLVETKYYRTPEPQIDLIEAAATRLRAKLDEPSGYRGMLVVSCTVVSKLRHLLERKFGITLIDRSDLYAWVLAAPEFADSLRDILESYPFPNRVDGGRDVSTSLRPKRNPAVQSPPDTRGTELCNALRNLNPGKEHWSAYENLCERIISYLFTNDLHGWHRQMWTDDDLNRFDFICRIKPNTDFWRFLIDHLNSRYILFEFKNYVKKIKQGQILTTEKYLLEKALRRASIVFTRLGADEDAIRMTQGAMREHGKLILVIDDEQVCKMLHMREKGEDPTDLLFEEADNFLLTLPR